MKHLHLTLVFCLMAVYGCTGGNKGASDLYEKETLEYFPVEKDELYLYIDSKGKEITQPIFMYADIFHEGMALVKDTIAGLYGYIDTTGKYAIAPKYKNATIFFNNIAWVAEPDSCLKAINRKGEILFTLPNIENASVFIEGIATIRNGEGKWGYINKKGKILVEPKYNSPLIFDNGKAVAETDEGLSVIDKDGNILLNGNEYNYIHPSSEGDLCYIVVLNDKYGLIDEEGKYIINPQYKKLSFDGSDLVSFTTEEDKKGWFDRKGNIVIEAKYKSVTNFGKGHLAAYSVDRNKYGFIDRNGKIVIRAKYDDVSSFLNGKAIVKKDHKRGIINEKGDYIAEPQFEGILPFRGEVTLARAGGKFGLIDANGKFIINPNYDGIPYEVFEDNHISILGLSDYVDVAALANSVKTRIEQLVPDITLGKLMEQYKLTEESITKRNHNIILEKYYNQFAQVRSEAVIPNVWIYSGYRKVGLNKEARPDSYQFMIEMAIGKADKGIKVLKEIRKALGMNEDDTYAEIGRWAYSIDEMAETNEDSAIFITMSPRKNETEY